MLPPFRIVFTVHLCEAHNKPKVLTPHFWVVLEEAVGEGFSIDILMIYDILVYIDKGDIQSKKDKLNENVNPVLPCFVSNHRVPGTFHLKQ